MPTPETLPRPAEAAAKLKSVLGDVEAVRRYGWVERLVGLTVEASGPRVQHGEICRLSQAGKTGLLAEVVGFQGNRVILLPLGAMTGVGPGSRVEALGRPLRVGLGRGMLGRILDGLGRPIDRKKPWEVEEHRAVDQMPPDPLDRPRITRSLGVGIRAIDGCLTCGRGQRVGIFAGSGVGKSTLLGMIARHTEADVNVIALVGERGREVMEFLEKDLGEEGLKRSVVVVATSDQPALIRLKAAFVATTVAEYFRDQGLDVLLMMDSVTRFAMAQREVGLAAGEPPSSRGYTPSVFALLPRLLERAGASAAGSITGFYTVLVEGDDMNEPISDAVRGILDGHLVLDRGLADRGHYPALDVLQSVSRVMPSVVDAEHWRAAQELRQLLADYRDAEDLIQIGAYRSGSDPAVDKARAFRRPAVAYLQQTPTQGFTFDEARSNLLQLAEAVAAWQPGPTDSGEDEA